MTTPKLSELQGLVTSTIAAAEYVTTKKVKVYEDDGLQQPKIENQLKKKGFAIVVCPLIAGKLRDQSGKEWIMDIQILVKLILNPERNNDTETGGLGVNIYEMIVAVAQALCGRARHPGGEFFKLGEDLFMLSKFDEGVWAYNMEFKKEGMAV